MNKYQEALDNQAYIVQELEQKNEVDFVFNLITSMEVNSTTDLLETTIQELVDRATPKKPNLLPTLHAFNGSEIEQQVELIECSCCEFCLKPSDKFCSNCGTEIDWSE